MKIKIIGCALFAVLCLQACAANDMKKTLEDSLTIVAHRGGAKLGIENSLSCIEAGIEAGAHMIEIDVHLSADSCVVVCHDPSVGRTTDGKGYISEMYLSQLKSLHLLDAGGNPTPESLPTLDEVLSLIDGRAELLLEIKYSKHSRHGLEEACVEYIRRHDAASWVVVQSFNAAVLERIHALAPEIRLEKLFYFASPALGLSFDGGFSSFTWDKYPYVSSFNVQHSLGAGKNFVRKCHERGYEVKVWTLNKRKEKLLERVDGVITDNPGLF